MKKSIILLMTFASIQAIDAQTITFLGNRHRVTTPSGYIDIGAQNGGWAHIYSDRPNFIFNKTVYSYNGQFSAYSTSDIQLQTNGTTRMRISQATGNVGIGTSSPSAKLDVKGDSYIGDLSQRHYLMISSKEWPEVRFQTPLSDRQIRLGIAHGAFSQYDVDEGDFYVYSQTVNKMPLIVKRNGNVTMNTSAGNVGIGTKTPYSKLEVSPASASWGEGIIVNPAPNEYSAIFFRETEGSISGTWSVGKQSSDNFAILRHSLSGMIGTSRPDAAFEVNYSNGNTLFGGNVGIGTGSPTYAKLQIKGGATHELFAVNRPNSDVPALYLGNAGSNNAAVAANNADLTFGRDFGGTYTEYARITNGTGNLGIGTTSPDEKLTVKGKIHVEEVKVDLSVPGPDYVFEEDYKLPTLESIEKFIRSNKHLPEIPPAKEMEENGLEIGTMNMLLLKKIEELTLYQIQTMKMIQQHQKKIDEQAIEIRQLKNKANE